MLYTNKDLKKLIIPLVFEQLSCHFSGDGGYDYDSGGG